MQKFKCKFDATILIKDYKSFWYWCPTCGKKWSLNWCPTCGKKISYPNNRGIYGIGFGSLLMNINSAINTLYKQLKNN